MTRNITAALLVGLALSATTVPAAAAPLLTIAPNPLHFGTVYTTVPTTKTVTLTNTGATDITLIKFSFNDTELSETDTCGGMIAAGGQCQVAVNITAASPEAIKGKSMSIEDTAAGSPQKLPLRGTVVALPACAAGTSGTFALTNPMLAEWRVYHTATTLQNGNVLLVGGLLEPVSTFLPGAEIFHFKTCKYSLPAVNTNHSREFHTATLLNDGRVLIAGGELVTGTGSKITASAEIFNPATGGSFSPTGKMHLAREYHAATLLADGRVLITGGLAVGGVTGSAEIYDPATGTFSLPSNMLHSARYQHTANLLADGKVLIAGGNGMTSAELFDPTLAGGKGAFRVLTHSMNFPRQAQTTTPLTVGEDAGELLVAGGYSAEISNGLSNAEVFDPTNDPLHDGTFATTANDMSVGRMSAVAARLRDGNVLVAGGTCNTTATGGQNSADLLMVSAPDVGNFEPTGNLEDGLVGHAAALLPDGEVLVTGGWRFTGCETGTLCINGNGCSSVVTNRAELYHP